MSTIATRKGRDLAGWPSTNVFVGDPSGAFDSTTEYLLRAWAYCKTEHQVTIYDASKRIYTAATAAVFNRQNPDDAISGRRQKSGDWTQLSLMGKLTICIKNRGSPLQFTRWGPRGDLGGVQLQKRIASLGRWHDNGKELSASYKCSWHIVRVSLYHSHHYCRLAAPYRRQAWRHCILKYYLISKTDAKAVASTRRIASLPLN